MPQVRILPGASRASPANAEFFIPAIGSPKGFSDAIFGRPDPIQDPVEPSDPIGSPIGDLRGSSRSLADDLSKAAPYSRRRFRRWPGILYLRGLFLVPLGGTSILAGLGNWEVAPLRHAGVFLAVLVAIGLTTPAISRYYNERYGRLRPSTTEEVRAAVSMVICIAVMFGGALLLRSRIGWSLDLPVNAIAIAFALVMLITYQIGVGLKAHHVVVWGAVLVAGALPVWTGADPSNVGLVMSGVALMISGLLDHRLFVRTFGSSSAPALENGNARA